jgi:hypothetical protein
MSRQAVKLRTRDFLLSFVRLSANPLRFLKGVNGLGGMVLPGGAGVGISAAW